MTERTDADRRARAWPRGDVPLYERYARGGGGSGAVVVDIARANDIASTLARAALLSVSGCRTLAVDEEQLPPRAHPLVVHGTSQCPMRCERCSDCGALD